jgi:ABC-type polysaccharide/polyol phosphate export permease
LIKQVRLPVTAYVFRVLYRNLIFFVHHLILIVGVLMWSGVSSALGVLASLLGFVFFVFILFWTCLAFAVLSARFRDVPLIVENVLQLIFYMTPIAWMPQMLREPYRAILDVNPIFYAIEIIRAPLISDLPMLHIYFGASIIGIVFTCIGSIAAGRSIKSIAYWV